MNLKLSDKLSNNTVGKDQTGNGDERNAKENGDGVRKPIYSITRRAFYYTRHSIQIVYKIAMHYEIISKTTQYIYKYLQLYKQP